MRTSPPLARLPGGTRVMSKYQLDGSNYENWKPEEEFPTGYVYAPRAVRLPTATPAAGAQSSYLGFRKCSNCMLCWAYCPDSSIEVEDGAMTGIDLFHCKGCGVLRSGVQVRCARLSPRLKPRSRKRRGSNHGRKEDVLRYRQPDGGRRLPSVNPDVMAAYPITPPDHHC